MANLIVISSTLLLFLVTNVRADCLEGYLEILSTSAEACSEICSTIYCSTYFLLDNKNSTCCVLRGAVYDPTSKSEPLLNYEVLTSIIVGVIVMISIAAVFLYLCYRHRRGLGFWSTSAAATTAAPAPTTAPYIPVGPIPPGYDPPPPYYSIQCQPTGFQEQSVNNTGQPIPPPDSLPQEGEKPPMAGVSSDPPNY